MCYILIVIANIEDIWSNTYYSGWIYKEVWIASVHCFILYNLILCQKYVFSLIFFEAWVVNSRNKSLTKKYTVVYCMSQRPESPMLF